MSALDPETAEPFVTVAVLMTHQTGLHARPSVTFTKLAKTFPCSISLATAPDGPWTDAKSIAKVMATRVPMGATLHLRARGAGAGEAVEALRSLVERHFDEGGVDAGSR